MAVFERRCPARFRDAFAADAMRGVSTRQLQEEYRRPDGSTYNLRTIQRWTQSALKDFTNPLVYYDGPISQYVIEGIQSLSVPPVTNDPPPPTPEEVVAQKIADAKRQEETIAHRAEERRLLKEAAHLDRVVQCIREEVPRLQTAPIRPYKIKTDLADESVLCFISDIQLGEKVERDSTSGLGYYNLEAFYERAERYYQAVIRLVEMHRTAANIRDLHVLFGGDIVEGTSIYPSQAFNIDILTVPQVIAAVKTFGEMLARFSAQLGVNIHVYGVPGNHGRIARKGTEPYMNNMDALVYRMMELHLAKHDRIKWHLSDSWFQLFKIQGHLFAAEHGDAVRGSLGIPLYGLMRRHNRLVMMTGEIIEALLIGHHHVPTSAETGFGCRAYINGSWVGTSDFSSHEMGLGSLPSQLLLGVNAHHGIVWERNIYLADPDEIRRLPIIDSEVLV